MKDKDNTAKITTIKEKLLAFIIVVFTGILGGFILSEYYRRSGQKEKVRALRPYMYLGLLGSLLLLIFLVSMSGGTPTQEPRDITPMLEFNFTTPEGSPETTN